VNNGGITTAREKARKLRQPRPEKAIENLFSLRNQIGQTRNQKTFRKRLTGGGEDAGRNQNSPEASPEN